LVKYISPSLVGPYGLNILRVGVSLLLFWTVWAFGKTTAAIKREHWGRFILCALTGVAINQMLFIKGLTMTSTIHASLLMLCTPLLITFFAYWILKEKLTAFKIAGLLFGIGGAILLILSKDNTGASSVIGDLLILSNAIAYTFYFILVKPLMKEYPPLHVIRWVFTIGFILILPFGWMQFSAIQWQQFEQADLFSLFFIVICGTFLAYYFNILGLKHLGAGITGSYIYTQPILAAIIARLVLHEHFTWVKLIAGLFIFCGVYLVSKKTPSIAE
jgi:drug/metabolite transporter (DMT)-like permease